MRSAIVLIKLLCMYVCMYVCTKNIKKHKTEALNTKHQKSNTEYTQKHCTILITAVYCFFFWTLGLYTSIGFSYFSYF